MIFYIYFNILLEQIRAVLTASPRAQQDPDTTCWHNRAEGFLDAEIMWFDFAVTALVTLFVVVDPVALSPTFLVVTEGMPRAARRSVAVRASIIAGIILAGAALVGAWLLATLEITLAAFRIAGGLLLFSIATEMVFGVRSRHEGEAAEQALEERVRNVAAFPLGIPLLAGPGAITAAVLLSGRADGNPILLATLIGVVVVVAAAALVSFLCAEWIGRLIGVTGNIVLSRLLGVLLAALAVQYVIDGIRTVLAG
jgi:multiple antibiotic resistance protein